MRLNDAGFIEIIKSAPLVAIDLIIRDGNGRILLGLRKNRPAKNCWFVPGGRILKNETIENAFSRIVSTELGIRYNYPDAEFYGVFSHIYDENCFDIAGVNTHYVVLAHQLRLEVIPVFKPDDQHSELRWWDRGPLLEAADVHDYTKAYFLPPLD